MHVPIFHRQAFFSIAFRPLYFFAAAWAIISIGWWSYAPATLYYLSMPSLYWHVHEMLWAFMATIAVAFLGTASATWTGINPLHGRTLGYLTTIWLSARILYLVPNKVALIAATVADTVFYIMAAACLARVILQSGNTRNTVMPILVLLLGLFHLGFMLQILRQHNPMPFFHAGFWLMAMLSLLIGKRVIPFFSSRVISNYNVKPHALMGKLQFALILCSIALSFTSWRLLQGVLFALLGTSCIYFWCAWQAWRSRSIPLLWVLYAAYLGIAIGFFSMAAYQWGWLTRIALPIHTMALLGMSLLIIGMLTRTSLGHLGQPLRANYIIVFSYICMLLAALLRLLAFANPILYQPALHSAALFWILCFAAYLYFFTPLLVQPRSDGKL